MKSGTASALHSIAAANSIAAAIGGDVLPVAR